MSEDQNTQTKPVEPAKTEKQKENIVIEVFQKLLQWNYKDYGIKKKALIQAEISHPDHRVHLLSINDAGICLGDNLARKTNQVHWYI